MGSTPRTGGSGSEGEGDTGVITAEKDNKLKNHNFFVVLLQNEQKLTKPSSQPQNRTKTEERG